jgi:hypothetical protein
VDTSDAHGTARTAGWATLAIGATLVLAPRTGRWSGLDDPRTARAVGAADLALVPGLLAGRPRWPWAAARAGLNLVQTVVVLRRGRGLAAWTTAASLVALAVLDGRAAATLRAAGE